MKKINWGIIGLGNIANTFSEGFLNSNKGKLLAISSHNKIKLEKFKNKFKIENKYVFKNYNDLIECNEIDVVYITLPNNLHYEWIMKCINKNKKILIEKPAFIDLKSAENVNNEIKKKNLFFSEGYMYRFYPFIYKIIEIIKNNKMGKLISMESVYGVNLLYKKKFFIFDKKKKINPKNRLFNKKMGGGCIFDLGCYPSSFSLLIASLNKDINYKKFELINVKKKFGITDVDIESEAEILFDNKFKSKIKASFESEYGNKSTIYFEKGELIIEDTWQGKGKLIQIFLKKKNIINFDIKKNIYSYEIEQVSESIQKNNRECLYPGMTMAETLLNTKILENWLNA